MDRFDNPGVQAAYSVLAEKKGIPSEKVRDRYLSGETYQCDMQAMIMDRQ